MSTTQSGPPDGAAGGGVAVACPACGARGRFHPKRELSAPVRLRCKGCGEHFRLEPPTRRVEEAPPRSAAAAGAAGSQLSIPPGPAGPRLEIGQELAQRFRIVAALGQGGMGEVYEAEDLELGGRVALKTVRPELAEQPDALDRFKREIQLARRVTHPNVCRVFDVVRHHREDAPSAPPIVFLTMELLAGETLAHRLARRERMSTEEALPIARQLASALDAAHRAGVVHRDFKSGNVMLVPEAGGGLRAVVTDFGLARPAPDSGVTAALTIGKDSLGTPDYMAPEQVEGGEITAAVDVYAFGVTLFEMVTGRRPFTGGSALTTAVRRLNEPPPAPTDLVPDLDPRWERMILRCLARRPEERFASAGEALRGVDEPPTAEAEDGTAAPVVPAPFPDPSTDPEPEDAATGAGTRRERPRDRFYRLKVIGLLGIIAVAAAVGIHRYTTWEPPESPVLQVLGVEPGEVVMRRSVAVVPLRDLAAGTDTGWLSTAVPEMLRTELRGGEALRVVGDESIARLDREIAAGAMESPQPGQLDRLRRALGADYVVTGSYALAGQTPARRLRLDLHLHDAVRGRTIASLSESGSEAELFELVARSGEELLRRLDVDRPAGDGGAPSLPVTPEAARLYSEGLARLNRYEPVAARELLERAAEIEPQNPLIRSALASAWSSLGYQGRAYEQARSALEAADSLPREERLSIEAQVQEAGGEWTSAAETYRGLWSLFPDDAEYGVRLVTAQIRAGRARDALTTVAALRTLPAPADTDPRVDLAESRAATAVGAFERAQRAAARGARLGEERGLAGIVAQARLAECEALRNLGRLDAALEACGAAERIADERGDRLGRVAALAGLGGVLYDRGDLEGAREHFEGAVEVHRRSGSQSTAAAILNNLAVVLRNEGDLERAGSLYAEALEVCRETGSQIGEAYTLGNLASLLIQQGELDRAAELSADGLEIVRALGDRGAEAAALDRLGVIAHLGGELDTARERFDTALAIEREIGQRRAETGTLAHMGRLALDAGDLDAAEELLRGSLALSRRNGHRDLTAAALFGLGLLGHERGDLERTEARLAEALEIQRELGQRSDSIETRAALARVALDRGRAAEAAALARVAANDAGERGLVDVHAWALAVTARALAAAGPPEQALATAEEALRAVEGTGNRRVSTAVAIETARARAAAGDGADRERARTELDRLAGPRTPFPRLAGEAARALARLGTAPGAPAGAAGGR